MREIEMVTLPWTERSMEIVVCVVQLKDKE